MDRQIIAIGGGGFGRHPGVGTIEKYILQTDIARIQPPKGEYNDMRLKIP